MSGADGIVTTPVRQAIPAARGLDPDVTTFSYPGTPASVSAGRHLVRGILARSPRLDEAELIAAELMTNAIRHTPSGRPSGSFTLIVAQRPGWARIEVRDLGDGQWPVPAGDEYPADRYAEAGRGLAIVAALADRCGHDRTEGRPQVCWAALTW